MKAAVMYRRNGPLKVEDVELTEPGPNDVSIRLAASGVCHSDLHHWRWEMGSPLPLILGHEGAGVVTQVGAGVTRVKPGDHALIAFGAKCGQCYYCLRGETSLCVPEDGVDPIETAYPSNRFSRNGHGVFQFQRVSSFAAETVTPANNVVVIPKDVPLDSASLVSCGVTTGVGAVINTAKVEVGSTVLVIGTGGVGLNVIQGARIAGRGAYHRRRSVGQQARVGTRVRRDARDQRRTRRRSQAGKGAVRRSRSRLRIRGDRVGKRRLRRPTRASARVELQSWSAYRLQKQRCSSRSWR